MFQPLPWRVAWVVGASSGIGREIALQLAKRNVAVAASARSVEKLATLGENIRSYPLDVTDPEGMREAANRIESEMGPIDLALFSAGTWQPVEASEIDPDLYATTMQVNYLGVVNGLAAVLPAMRRRRSGRIAWIASVAGYRGLPKASAYGPSKAALINLAESLKPELERDGVAVSVVNAGFVATPLTAGNTFKMPFLMLAPEAARRTIEGLARGKFEIIFPRRFVALLKIARVLPYAIYFWLIRKAILKS